MRSGGWRLEAPMLTTPAPLAFSTITGTGDIPAASTLGAEESNVAQRERYDE
jgi:hypothetical protein